MIINLDMLSVFVKHIVMSNLNSTFVVIIERSRRRPRDIHIREKPPEPNNLRLTMSYCTIFNLSRSEQQQVVSCFFEEIRESPKKTHKKNVDLQLDTSYPHRPKWSKRKHNRETSIEIKSHGHNTRYGAGQPNG